MEIFLWMRQTNWQLVQVKVLLLPHLPGDWTQLGWSCWGKLLFLTVHPKTIVCDYLVSSELITWGADIGWAFQRGTTTVGNNLSLETWLFGNRKSHHAAGISSFQEASKAFVCVFAFSSPFSMFILQASLFPTQTFQMLQNSLNHCHHYHWNGWKFISAFYSLTLRRLFSGHDSAWKPNICSLGLRTP